MYTASLVQVLKLKTLYPFITDIRDTVCIAGMIVCYFESWATYFPGNGKFDVETIDPNLCTHLIYSFMGVNENADVTILDSWNDIDLGEYLLITSLNVNAVSMSQTVKI